MKNPDKGPVSVGHANFYGYNKELGSIYTKNPNKKSMCLF